MGARFCEMHEGSERNGTLHHSSAYTSRAQIRIKWDETRPGRCKLIWILLERNCIAGLLCSGSDYREPGSPLDCVWLFDLCLERKFGSAPLAWMLMKVFFLHTEVCPYSLDFWPSFTFYCFVSHRFSSKDFDGLKLVSIIAAFMNQLSNIKHNTLVWTNVMSKLPWLEFITTSAHDFPFERLLYHRIFYSPICFSGDRSLFDKAWPITTNIQMMYQLQHLICICNHFQIRFLGNSFRNYSGFIRRRSSIISVRSPDR